MSEHWREASVYDLEVPMNFRRGAYDGEEIKFKWRGEKPKELRWSEGRNCWLINAPPIARCECCGESYKYCQCDYYDDDPYEYD